jgi:sorbitol/mannitol transport system substrate-binding protein
MKFTLKQTLVGTFGSLAFALSGGTAQAADLVIATVNNGHMIEMQKLTPQFEKANPDIKVKWVTLEEGVLRQRVTTDIATKGGQFDIMTIGMYETPIWGKKGWLKPIATDAAYDVDDLLPAMRNGLSVDGKLYAAPFYGESSMLMYRKDLADKAGVQIPDKPTWDQVADFAKKAHNPPNVYGICLRGKPGWGDNMAFLSTLVNTFGGQWFDMKWKPQLESKPWKEAVTFYVDLLTKYGPPGSSANSFNEILALTNEGKCAIRSRARSPRTWPSRRRRRRTPPRARTGCGLGRWPFPPAPRTKLPRRSSSSGPRARNTSNSSARRTAGARCPPARARAPTPTRSS